MTDPYLDDVPGGYIPTKMRAVKPTVLPALAARGRIVSDQVGDVAPQRRREIDLMLLFDAENLANLFGNGVLANRFALLDADSVVPYGFVFILQIELE